MGKSSNKKSQSSQWIANNPKKTGFILIIIALFTILFIVDKSLNFFLSDTPGTIPNIKRAINLREHHPGLDIIVRPNKDYLANTDNLLVQDYPFRVDYNGFLLPHNNYDNPDHNIVFIGGSTTECMYVTEDKRFPYLTGQIIEEKTNKQINSYNSAAAGNSLMHSIDIFLNKIIPMNPDVVVIMHAINDYTILAYDQTYWPKDTPRSELFVINDYFPKIPKATILWHLKGIVRLIYPNIYYKLNLIKEKILSPQKQSEVWDEWRGRRHRIKDRNIEFMQNEFRWAMQLLVTACKSHGIQPLLMTQANRFKVNPDDLILKSIEPMLSAGINYKTFKKEYDSFNNITREIALSNNIPLIDLANLVPQDNEYIYDSVHYNDSGSVFVANIISQKLIDILSNQ